MKCERTKKEILLTASLTEDSFCDAPRLLGPSYGSLNGRVPRRPESLEEHQVLPAGAHAKPDGLFVARRRWLATAPAVVVLPEHEPDMAPQPLGHLALHHLEDPHGGKVEPVERRGSVLESHGYRFTYRRTLPARGPATSWWIIRFGGLSVYSKALLCGLSSPLWK